MKYAFIAAQNVAYSVAVMCEVLGVSRSGYYAWRSQPETARERRDADLLPRVKAAFAEHQGRYGSPRVANVVGSKDAPVNVKRIARVMRENGLVARPKKRFIATTDSNHEDPIAPNLLQRDFTADAPNRVWTTDVTAIWTHAGWLFLAAIIDLFSRRIVGWATSTSNDQFLALEALHFAITARAPHSGLVHHSDRGSPYASRDYRAALAANGMLASMSRRGDCWDNAVSESFFSTLKTEALRHHVPADHAAGRRILREYIDDYYNTKRHHSYLDYETPIEFELKKAISAKTAA